MKETEGAGARQLLADYKTRLQYGAGRVPGVVPAGAAARLHKGHCERVEYRWRPAGWAEVKMPRVITSRSTMENQISTWFSHEEQVGVK
jgi:hypothetical protein